MPEIGWAGLGVVPEVSPGFYSKLERDIDPGLARAGKSSGSRFGSLLGKAAAVTAVGALGAGIAAFRFGKDAIGLAANFEQSVGAVDAIFEKSSGRIHRWADDAADDVGLTANEFNELGTLIGAQLKNGGTAMDELAPKTHDLIQLGADMSSMFGGNTREAVEALSSALKGERDPIERYGVSLRQSTIDAEAAELGFKKVDGALSSEAQQAATLSLIMEQTADAHGNFAREADTLSGKQQRLRARLEDVKTEIGTALLPIMTDAADFLLDKGVPAFEKFSDWFADEGIDGIKKFGGFVEDDVIPVVKDLGGFLEDAAGFGADVAKVLDDLPGSTKWASLAAVVGGVGALKLRGGGGGALGKTGSALGLSRPVPVTVTNWAQVSGGGADGVVGSDSKRGRGGKRPRRGGRGGGLLAATVLGPYIFEELAWGVTDPKSPLTDLVNPTPGPGGGGFTSKDLQGMDLGISGINKNLQGIPDAAAQVVAEAEAIFRESDIKEIRTVMRVDGVPAAKTAARELIAQYDLTPKDKRTLFELVGFDRTMERLRRIDAELDWVARPREARIDITKAYAQAGYETRGGLQEGGGGPVARDRRRAGGGV